MTTTPTPTGPPTQSWGTPPRRRGRWLRGLTITALATLGAFIGAMAGSAFAILDINVGTVLMLVGTWLGLALGIWAGFRVTSRQHQHRPIDPARYPNRIISVSRRPH